MLTSIKVQEFLSSEEGIEARKALLKMMKDDNYNTTSTYSPASKDGDLLFIDKHMNYLCTHLGVDSLQYVSNLRLITKKK